MRSEIRTAIAALATAAVLMGSATMALAADDDTPGPGPTESTATASPSPSESTTAPSSSPSTATPTTPEPTGTTSEPTPTPEPTAPTTTTPAPEAPPTGAFTVTDAQVRWGINDESNNRAFAPGTFNFLSAGKIPDPGRGGVIMPESAWSQSSGNVAIEKFLNGAWTPATWAGLRTTSTGTTMSGTNGPFSTHEVVISGGTGTVDPAAGTASIQWTGSFSVVYYSGYSFFYVTDPRLTVTGGIGTLTGTLSGYASSMEDLEKWQAVTPVPDVTLADLGPVDLTADLGFSAQPAYAGVAVALGADQVPQVRTGTWGSFPQSFINYQTTSGTGAYWYSSGGSADAHKVAKPVTVSYAAGAPVKVKAPVVKKTKKAKVDNDAPDAPGNDAPSLPALLPPPASLSLPAPVAGETLQSSPAIAASRPSSTVTGLRPVSADRSDDDATGVWILGGLLLVATALVAASPFAYSAVRKAR